MKRTPDVAFSVVAHIFHSDWRMKSVCEECVMVMGMVMLLLFLQHRDVLMSWSKRPQPKREPSQPKYLYMESSSHTSTV
jgi:hypothetical protein